MSFFGIEMKMNLNLHQTLSFCLLVLYLGHTNSRRPVSINIYMYNLKFSKNSLISMIVHTGSLSDIEHILIDRRLSLGGCKSYRRPKIFFWIDNLF